MRAHLADLLEWKNLTLTKVYGAKSPYTMTMLEEWIAAYCDKLKPYICDAGAFLRYRRRQRARSILFEAQLGALRDLDYGIYPYHHLLQHRWRLTRRWARGLPSPRRSTMSSASIKAYSTCVGEGPFVCELYGEEAERAARSGRGIRRRHRPPAPRRRRMDVVATRYGVGGAGRDRTGADQAGRAAAIWSEIPVCVRYLVDGRETDRFPFPAALAGAKPVLEYMEGWNCGISGVRRWEDLPPAAQRYVLFVEQAVGCPITYVSVGPERDSIILRGRGKV